jgi:lipoprotein NlpI
MPLNVSNADFRVSVPPITDQTVDPNLRIALCNDALDSGDLSQEGFATAYCNRGNAYAAIGELKRAIDDYNRALAIDAHRPSYYCDRAFALADLGQHDRAFADFDRAIAIAPDLAANYASRGVVFSAMGELDSAIADYDRALHRGPPEATTHYNRGNAHFDRRNLDLAIADYDSALRLDPWLRVALINRGFSFVCQGNFDAAMTDYDRAIELGQLNGAAYAARGCLHFYRGAFRAAHRDFSQAIVEGDKSPLRIAWNFVASARIGLVDLALEWTDEDDLCGNWPWPIVRYLVDDLSEFELLQKAGGTANEARHSQLTEAHFFIGQSTLCQGGTEKARWHFSQAVAQDVFGNDGSLGAAAELRRIDGAVI